MLCRARRLLNPFRGVMQTIDVENADAASVDGQRWGLYISDEASYDFIDLNSVVPFHSTDVKYGEWSEKQGLLRSPLLPSINQDKVRELGESILNTVKSQSRNVPFTLTDNYERWLLDDQQARPAVLLESAYDLEAVTYNSNTVWRVGQLAQREFRSLCLDSTSGAQQAADRLQMQVNRLCKKGRSIWVRRGSTGEAVVLPKAGETQRGEQRLAGKELPVYGLRTDWPDEQLNCLTRDYLHWLSPWLLVMTPEHVEGLEDLIAQAVQYPSRLYQIRHLLPIEIRALKEVRAALVQADLSRNG